MKALNKIVLGGLIVLFSNIATAAQCTADQPIFTLNVARSQLSAWETSLQTAAAEPNLIKSGAKFAAQFYDTNATLLPTVSNQIRRSQKDLADYFEHFLKKKPQFDGKPYEETVNGFCGHGTYSGNYDFALNNKGTIITVKARFTYEYEYLPRPDEGRKPGWYIETHHSSAQPADKTGVDLK